MYKNEINAVIKLSENHSLNRDPLLTCCNAFTGGGGGPRIEGPAIVFKKKKIIACDRGRRQNILKIEITS